MIEATIDTVKRQLTDQEKIFAACVIDKGVTSLRYKELFKIAERRTKKPTEKWETNDLQKYKNSPFTYKNCSEFLLIREMQTTSTNCFSPVGSANMKKHDTLFDWQGFGDTHSAGGNANWCQPFVGKFGKI